MKKFIFFLKEKLQAEHEEKRLLAHQKYETDLKFYHDVTLPLYQNRKSELKEIEEKSETINNFFVDDMITDFPTLRDQEKSTTNVYPLANRVTVIKGSENNQSTKERVHQVAMRHFSNFISPLCLTSINRPSQPSFTECPTLLNTSSKEE